MSWRVQGGHKKERHERRRWYVKIGHNVARVFLNPAKAATWFKHCCRLKYAGKIEDRVTLCAGKLSDLRERSLKLLAID